MQKNHAIQEDVLTFWFKELEPAQWWEKSATTDQIIRNRFSTVHTRAVGCELFGWRNTALGRLAEILVLDQFSRNMFRDSALAFANDNLALALAQEAVRCGADALLTPIERSFLYMPYMHSESLLVHEVAAGLYQKNGLQNNMDFELKHKRIIEQFGRYPHRNLLLGRSSTAEEVEFLKQPNSSF